MNKTIASLALLVASIHAAADLGPPLPGAQKPVITKICIKTYKESDGSLIASCDASNLNAELKRKLLASGCAKGQISMTLVNQPSPLDSCLPPGLVQL